MLVQRFVQPPQDGYPFYTCAKRYWLPELENNASDPRALTLIVLHSTSFHKETWEPTLERLMHASSRPGSSVKILEAWAFDCPNHGEAGELNGEILTQKEFANHFTCEKYAEAVHRFLSAGHGNATQINFEGRNLVGIGHSLGANTMLLIQHMHPSLPFSSLIVVEPMLSPAGRQHLDKLRALLVKGAYERRDVWPNREQAMAALKRRERTRKWHPQILDLYVKYAIRPHPGSYATETPYPGVTLSCTRDQEAAMYRDMDGATKPMEDLNRLCSVLPIHLILGGEHDFIPARVHTALVDPNSGRKYASVTKLEGVGHLIPQEAPEKLGTVIYSTLEGNMTSENWKTKL